MVVTPTEVQLSTRALDDQLDQSPRLGQRDLILVTGRRYLLQIRHDKPLKPSMNVKSADQGNSVAQWSVMICPCLDVAPGSPACHCGICSSRRRKVTGPARYLHQAWPSPLSRPFLRN
ncbi:hypothetical protein RRG08_018983 [Elysia crispata]|uniref:Uncharacterized protein n=1 Tax=Elysia crispata TaxID=231223 RepID=A0AAE1A5H5_9GAST|nr:hypothetical protein RRG08_018983 [Elysia crispata]